MILSSLVKSYGKLNVSVFHAQGALVEYVPWNIGYGFDDLHACGSDQFYWSDFLTCQEVWMLCPFGVQTLSPGLGPWHCTQCWHCTRRQ